MATVIIGAGIIGTSTAYYLSQSDNTDPASIHLVESSPELFASASGYAAGFLARDWFRPALASLGALSFDLHKELAERNDGTQKWAYSKSTGTSLEESMGKKGEDWLLDGVSRSVAAKSTETQEKGDDRPTWLKGKGRLDVISSGDSTAQVDPLPLCRFLLQKCLSRGVHLHHPAHAISISRTASSSLESIRIATLSEPASSPQEIALPCNRLVLAAGAWTPHVHRTLFPSSQTEIPITSLAGHSLLLRSPHWPPPPPASSSSSSSLPPSSIPSILTSPPAPDLPPCHALFTTDHTGYAPELFSRSPGHIYIAGLNSSSYPLPRIPTERVLDPASIATLHKTAARLLGEGLVVEREGVCWRPVTRTGLPIVGPLIAKEKVGRKEREEEGVFVAAGHGAWGISLSLGTGFVVAGMVEGKEELGADVRGLGL
ncbi:MAG: hypothetical protein Q9195_006302 [Heterodermia aff. obscurata]